MAITESASQLERLARCPASAALPQVQTTTEYSSRGSVVHRYLELARSAGRESALDAIGAEVGEDDATYELCAAIDLEALPEGVFAAEVAFAVDAATGQARELGRGVDRDYSDMRPFEIPGTADAVAVSMDAVFVPDWKTGWSEVQPPSRNRQLRFLALAAARTYDRDHALVEVVRIREDGSVYRQRAELDSFDLQLVAAELRELHFDVERARAKVARGEGVEVHEGSWCRYCPAYVYCPAKTRLVRELVAPGNDPVEQIAALDLRSPLDLEVAGHAYRKVRAAEALVKRIKSALHDLAARHPFPIAETEDEVTYYGLQEVDGKETLDGQIAWRVLAELRGREIADEVVKRVMTKKAIDTAVRRTLRPREKIKAGNEEVLEAIRAAGGASKPRGRKVVEYTVERAAEDGEVSDG